MTVHASAHRTPRGFTLIEILVVVAIIALLISILLPSLAAARLQARTAVCLSHLRQLTTANYYYSGDNRGLLPHYDRWLWAGNTARPEVPESGTLFGLRGASQDSARRRKNYAVNREIYKCPADGGQRKAIVNVSNPLLPAMFSYSRNVYLLDVLRDTKRWRGEYVNGVNTHDYLPIEMPPDPARTVLFFEEYESAPMNDGYVLNNQYDFLTERHNGRAMVPYHDLHVAGVLSRRFNKSTVASDYRHYFLAPGLPRP